MAARKTSAGTRARTAPATKATENGGSNLEVFNEYRARAAHFTIPDRDTTTIPPYVLGPEMGFDPPIEVTFPEDIERAFLLEKALQNNNYLSALDVLLGGNMIRVVRRFKSEPGPERLLLGLVMTITDHFMGRGASEVPGGSSPS